MFAIYPDAVLAALETISGDSAGNRLGVGNPEKPGKWRRVPKEHTP
jgi:hypothetical protein